MKENSYDCIILGAGPSGLQAAIHLARYNRKVLLIDHGGGRTRHALHIENYLGLEVTSGKEPVDTGIQVWPSPRQETRGPFFLGCP